MSEPNTFGQPKYERYAPTRYAEDVDEDESSMNFSHSDSEKEFSYYFPNVGYGEINIKSPNVVRDQKYKFDEDDLIAELKEYIDGTYESHYSKNKFQSTEFIVDCGHGDGFCMGNIIKYAQRYGKKNGKNRKDLLKIMHYAIIALSVLDNEDDENENL